MLTRFSIFTFVLLALFVFDSVRGQTAPSTNAAPVAAAPLTIPIGDIVSQADTITAQLNDMDASLTSDAAIKKKDDKLRKLTLEIDRRVLDAKKVLESNPSLPALRTTGQAWQGVSDKVAVLKKDLSDRSRQLDSQLDQLSGWSAQWKLTQTTIAPTKTSPPGTQTPPEILKRVADVITKIDQIIQSTKNLQALILAGQNQVSEQDTRVNQEMDKVRKAQDEALKHLFVSDSVPIWETGTDVPVVATNTTVNSAQEQLDELKVYLKSKISTFVIQFLLFVIFSIAFYRVRSDAYERAKTDPAWEHTARIFDAPLATAALLPLIGSHWLFTAAPRLFWAGIVAAMLIPAVIILRRLIDEVLFSVLYAMVIFYVVDQWRYLIVTSEIWSRFLLLGELMAGTLYVLWLIRAHRNALAKAQNSNLARTIIIYARVALIVFVLAGFAEILGYSRLANLMGNAMFESGYLAVIFYAAALILDGLTKTALKVWPLRQLGMVRRHYLRLCQNLSRFFRWLAFGLWLTFTLELFSIRAPVWTFLSSLFVTGSAGDQTLTTFIGKPLVFGLIVWASFLVSKFIRFVLDEEIFSHLTLAPGVPYAASTMVHYAILVLGFFACINVVGAMSQFTVLAGAFMVGLGFGLQNIMNNFVSGIILLFERPIKLGDVIQLGTDIGVVGKIGIRASVIRLDNGAEIIVPNGNLISAQVTNWTLSNRQRVVQIPISVSPKTDPQAVMKLLISEAKSHKEVLASPAPEVLLLGFTPTALNFELRIWIDSFDEWMKVRSDLSLSVSAALARENIATV